MSIPRHATDRESLELSCTVEFVRASGPGGQHRNKRSTGVRLVHEPTGTMVMATERRSQSMNKELAFERMAKKLEALQHRPKKRRPTRPTRGSVKRRLEGKRKASEKKKGRRRPED
jgi:protein subunit release factor B